MKRFLIFGLMTGAFLTASAQSMREVWVNMPDSVAPYLNKSLRTELADYVRMKTAAKVQNLLGDTTIVDELTADYLSVRLTPASKLEAKLLNKNTLVVVKTWNAPAADSEIALYGTDWKAKPLTIQTELQTNVDSLAAVADPEELRLMLRPHFVVFQLSKNDNSLTVDYSFPLLNKADKKRVGKVVRKRYFKWNGNKFVE